MSPERATIVGEPSERDRALPVEVWLVRTVRHTPPHSWVKGRPLGAILGVRGPVEQHCAHPSVIVLAVQPSPRVPSSDDHETRSVAAVRLVPGSVFITRDVSPRLRRLPAVQTFVALTDRRCLGRCSSGYIRGVKVKYRAAINRDDRAEVKEWMDDHKSDNIDLVVIGAGVIAIYDSPSGPNREGCGLASLDRDGMTAALDEALAKLRSNASGPVGREGRKGAGSGTRP
jgi:hypothetical protein